MMQNALNVGVVWHAARADATLVEQHRRRQSLRDSCTPACPGERKQLQPRIPQTTSTEIGTQIVTERLYNG